MSMTPQEINAMAESVAKRVSAILTGQPRLIDRYSLAERLGLSVPTIERLTRNGKISVICAGRRRLYDPDKTIAELANASDPKAAS